MSQLGQDMCCRLSTASEAYNILFTIQIPYPIAIFSFFSVNSQICK